MMLLSAVSHLLAIVDWNFNNKLADICGASVRFLSLTEGTRSLIHLRIERWLMQSSDLILWSDPAAKIKILVG